MFRSNLAIWSVLLSTLFLSMAFSSCSSSQVALTVPANQTVELDYVNYDLFQAKVSNRSAQGINVAVLSKATDEQVKGFGLGKRASAKVMVEKPNKLVFKNETDKATKLKVSITEAEMAESVPQAQGRYISFTLQNKTAQSIPLIIPNVMNPNLSPFSKSGVNLEIGQEILFREKGKRYVLFTVDASIQEGELVDVAKILKERKQELGL